MKLKILEFPASMSSFEGKDVYLRVAAPRPETMYGQTNCFVLPEGEYGIYEMPGDWYLVCSERAMKNIAHQDLTHEFGQFKEEGRVMGSDLIGVPLKAPLCPFEKVYVLPLLTISMNKGTGVVTSVPSDAPADWAALNDFRTKADFRSKYGVKEEWVKDFEPVPIIEIPEYGNMIAEVLCKQFKVKS